MLENLFLVIASAIIIEALIEVVKGLAVKEIHTAAIRGLAIALGMIFAVNFDLDLLAMFDFTGRTCVVGVIATGILIGSGSGLVYDIIESLKAVNVEKFNSKEQEELGE